MLRSLTHLLSLTVVLLVVFGSAQAGSLTLDDTASVAAAQQQPPVDDHDDTRVEVQLVVAGIAAAVVVGAGLAGYLLRKRLGLVAGPPDQSAKHH